MLIQTMYTCIVIDNVPEMKYAQAGKLRRLGIIKWTMAYSLIRIFCQSFRQRRLHDYLHDKLIVLIFAECNYDLIRCTSDVDIPHADRHNDSELSLGRLIRIHSHIRRIISRNFAFFPPHGIDFMIAKVLYECRYHI